MHALRRIGFALVAVFAVAGGAAASDESRYLLLEGALLDYEDLKPGDENTGGLRAGAGFPLARSEQWRLALEASLYGNPIERVPAADGTQFGLMLDLVPVFELGRVDPFLFAGLGLVLEDGASGSADPWPAVEAGFGAQIGETTGTRLRASLSVQEVFNDDLSAMKDSFTDHRFNLGVLVPFGAAPAAPRPPADSDGDGVVDTLDRCPAQAAATADGCPAAPPPAQVRKDSDGDGVDDSRDECPGTLAGLKVDASGCVVAASAQTIVLQGVTFLSGSTELTAAAKAVLDQAASALAGQTRLKVEVGGHTDSLGNDAVNLALSQRRADAVRGYLVGKGVGADRLTAKGYGETRPIADNGTPAGRQQNRRVELKILN